MPTLQQQTTLRFGLFQLDLQARELYRGGIRIRLAPQPYELLVALMEQPGSVVTREVLRQRLWPNTCVDYEHGLNKTVRKLREVLGDSAESPRYIETVQRSGYRFIAPVLQPEAPVALLTEPASSDPAIPLPSSSSPAPEAAAASKSVWYRPAAMVVGLCLIAGLITATLILRRPAPHSVSSVATKPVNPKAQDAYLHGRYLWSGEHALASSDYFKQAIELEPDYGPGWAGMSMYYGAALIRGRLDPAEGLGLLQEASEKALRFAPGMPEAHLAACGSIFLSTWRYRAANAECNRALQLDPANAEVYHFQSKMLAALHREEDALAVQRTSSRLDPLSRPWALGQALMQARRYDEAFTESRARLDSFPHDATLLRLLADISRYRGYDAQAADYLEQSYRFSGDEPSAMQIHDAYGSGGSTAVARWDLERLLKQGRTGYTSPFRLALAYIALGDREQAISMLSQALDRHDPELLWVRCYPEFESLATDARYRQIVQKLPTL